MAGLVPAIRFVLDALFFLSRIHRFTRHGIETRAARRLPHFGGDCWWGINGASFLRAEIILLSSLFEAARHALRRIELVRQ